MFTFHMPTIRACNPVANHLVCKAIVKLILSMFTIGLLLLHSKVLCGFEYFEVATCDWIIFHKSKHLG